MLLFLCHWPAYSINRIAIFDALTNDVVVQPIITIHYYNRHHHAPSLFNISPFQSFVFMRIRDRFVNSSIITFILWASLVNYGEDYIKEVFMYAVYYGINLVRINRFRFILCVNEYVG